MSIEKRKNKILFYSDCYYFAGCENMLATLFNSQKFMDNYEVMFAYGYSKKYEGGLKSRLRGDVSIVPLKYFTINELFSFVNFQKSVLTQKIFTGLIKFFLLEYIFFVYDFFRLLSVFKKIRPDLLHINNGGYPGSYSCESAVFAARYAGIKNITFVINNMITPYDKMSRRLEKPIDNYVKKYASVFVTGSESARIRIIDLWNLDQEKAVNIPNSITARPIVESRQSVLRRLKIPEGRIVLGNIAALEKRKGQKYLLEAWALIKKSSPDYEKAVLVIEGEGREEKYLLELADKLGISEKVKFTGREKNIFDLINAIDVFILPSIENEDFPNVILESMSMGKPIIGTNIAGIPEQIENNVNGLLVHPGNPEKLAEAMLKLIRDNKLREEMGKKSSERFNLLFSNEKIIGRYMDLYDKLMLNQ